jgi:hypothetical protein
LDEKDRVILFSMAAPIGTHPDGLYFFHQIHDALEPDFKSEKDLVDYLEDNIQLFCKDLLHTTYKSHKREYRIALSRLRGNRSPRIDLLITDQSGKNILVECKNPKYSCENQSAIGQILAYKEMCKLIELRLDRIALLTTKLDSLSIMVLKNNDLGIELIGFDKKKALTLIGQNGH